MKELKEKYGKSLILLEECYQDFATHNFMIPYLRTVSKNLGQAIMTAREENAFIDEEDERFVKGDISLALVQYFLERVVGTQDEIQIPNLQNSYTEQLFFLRNKPKNSAREQLAKGGIEIFSIENTFSTIQAKRMSEFIAIHKPQFTNTSLPTQQTQHDASLVTDQAGNIVGVVVYRQFKWLCNVSEIARIMIHLAPHFKLSNNQHNALAKIAYKLAPDSAAKKAFLTGVTQTIKDIRSEKNISTGKIDIEGVASKVLSYLAASK
jgi:hypothetical protein